MKYLVTFCDVDCHTSATIIIYNHIMIKQDKKRKKEYETEVLKRKQGIENARNERELREYQDQMQNSFVKNFESGELVH